MRNILKNIRSLLKEDGIINEKEINLLIKDIENWEKGMTIFPSDIKKLLNINFYKTYYILDLIKDIGILSYEFAIYCEVCNEYLNEFKLKSLNEFPKNLLCKNNHKLNPLDNTIVLYKVIDI